MSKTQNNLHVVVGLGVTGLSCVRYLRTLNIPVAVTDTRISPPQLAILKREFPEVDCALGQLDEKLLQTASMIVLSPGVSLKEAAIAKAVESGVSICGDIELFAQTVKYPVIAITGTNAKSTVTTLVGLMMSAENYRPAVGGNLGVPALELLQDPKANVYVLELSSFQLETTYTLRSAVATVLNITPDHLDRYGTLTAYQKAKLRVYQHCNVAVYNADDALTVPQTQHTKTFAFTLQSPKVNQFGLIQKNKETYLAFGDQVLLSVKELPIRGKHYQANALAALAIGYAFGLSFPAMLKVLKEFKGLPHRCQLVRERQGVRWYNDSKGTNVGATQAALEGLGSEINGKLILIAGGLGKNANFSTLLPSVKKYVRHLVLIGEAAQEIASAMGTQVEFSFAQSMDDAIQKAAAVAQSDDCVLLSPACASYDMFKNFEHRGQVFMEIVERL